MRASRMAAIAVSIAVLLCGAALLLIHGGHASQRQAEVDSLVTLRQTMRNLGFRLGQLEEQLSSHTTDATKASLQRHDRAVAGSSDADLLPLAKRESADIRNAQAINEQIEDAANSIVQDFSARYGTTTSRLSQEAGAMHDACENSLNDWGRAIGDIQDSIEASINGTDDASASDSERYYSDSDREMIQCNRHTSNVFDQLTGLDKRLVSDIGVARAELEKF